MMEEFNYLETLDYELLKSKLVEPIDPKEIKERSGSGGIVLRYVNGKYVTDRLIECTNNTYKFEVLSFTTFKSEAKEAKVWNEQTRKYVGAVDENGNKKYDMQAPYVIVHGRLTIPGLGSREQFGSSELLGGSGEQCESFKSAATDCLKKCASLFGIALELYEPVQAAAKPQQSGYQKNGYQPAKQKVEQVVNNQEYKKEDTAKLKELKQKMGIEDNAQLNQYVAEFSGNKTATWESITPSNIAAFNVHLQKRVGG